jgi:hypothetical protein
MLTETTHSTSVPVLEATATTERNPPGWFARLIVIARWFWSSWCLIPVCSAAPTRRADATPAIDVLLWMLACAVSQTSVRETERLLKPWGQALAQVWQRDQMCGRCAVSRFLAESDVTVVQTWRTLFCPPCAFMV